MSLLVDTHVLLWLITGDARLSQSARAGFLDPINELFLSAASYWEICIKVGIGKLTLMSDWPAVIDRELTVNGIEWLPITKEHCQTIVTLPFHHRDPFDRIIVAQAICEGLSLLSDDPVLRQYDAPVVW